MEKKLLKHFGCCLQCLSTDKRTKDHIIAKMMGKAHPEVLGLLVPNSRNLAPFCWPDHQVMERVKQRAFRDKGVSGLIVYLAKRYPKSPSNEMLVLENNQLVFLFSGIAANIQRLNGDAPRQYREDYNRALETAQTYADRLQTLRA